MRRIRIFETTLRGGEQSPGIELRTDEEAAPALTLAWPACNDVAPGATQC